MALLTTLLLNIMLAFGVATSITKEETCTETGVGSCTGVVNQDQLSMLQVSLTQSQNRGIKEHFDADAEEAATSDDTLAPEEDDDVTLSPEQHFMSGTWRMPTEDQAKEFLKATNMYRCMHGADPLQWSDDVAENANGYITPMTQMIHSKSYDVPPPAGPAGENLGWESAGQVKSGNGPWKQDPSWHHMSAADMVKAWYSEYDNCARKKSGAWDGCVAGIAPSENGPNGVCPDPGSLGQKGSNYVCQLGHFTSMIWQGVKTMGCAYSASTNPQVQICRYKAGDTKTEDTPNMNRATASVSHVFKKTKNMDQCGGIEPVGGWLAKETQPAQESRAQGRNDPPARKSSDVKVNPPPAAAASSGGGCSAGNWNAPMPGTCSCKQDECTQQKCAGKGYSYSCAESHSIRNGQKVAGSDTITKIVCAC